MLQGKQSFTVTTRKDKDSPEKNTALTIDWTGCGEEVAKQLATQALVVKVQGGWRKNGIPASATILVKDHAPGTRSSAPVTVEGIKAAAETFSPEDRAALRKLLSELDKAPQQKAA